jgi:putative tryptophan/tyrosine transport system substrate-binding protein
LLAIASLAARAAGAQGKPPVPHIGILSTGTVVRNTAFIEALRDSLRELGYIDGGNVAIDVRFAGNNAGMFPELASSLVKDRADVLVGTCIPSTRAAKGVTQSVPIVMSVDGDPVASGLVASLAHPGGNVTGTWTLFEELIEKWLELLHAAVPNAQDIALLSNPGNVTDPFFSARFSEAAKRIGVRDLRVESSNTREIDLAFGELKQKSAGGLVVMTEAFFAGQVQQIVGLAARYRVPAIYGYREFAEAGGLMSYGVSYRDYFKRVARYIDAVLKGAKPADLPVEQPTKIELVINLATAKRLGIAMPPVLLLRADRVIE